MAGHSIITYKGKEISYLDYRGMKLEEILKTIDEASKKSLLENKRRLQLTNITGVFAVPEFMNKVKEAGKKTKHLTSKSAVVGITGAKKLLLSAYITFTGTNMKAFDDEESAKEWLVKD
jgi:hypothetical protein